MSKDVKFLGNITFTNGEEDVSLSSMKESLDGVDNKIETAKLQVENYTDTKIQEISESGFIPVQSDWEAEDTTENGGINYAYIQNKPDLFTIKRGQKLGQRTGREGPYLTSLGWIELDETDLSVWLSKDNGLNWENIANFNNLDNLPSFIKYSNNFIAVIQMVTDEQVNIHILDINNDILQFKQINNEPFDKSSYIAHCGFFSDSQYWYIDLYGGYYIKINNNLNIEEVINKPNGYRLFHGAYNGQYLFNYEYVSDGGWKIYNLSTNTDCKSQPELGSDSEPPKLLGGNNKLYVTNKQTNSSWVSDDNGSSWVKIDYQIPTDDYITINTSLFFTYNGQYSTDEVNWKPTTYYRLQTLNYKEIYGIKDYQIYVTKDCVNFQDSTFSSILLGKQDITEELKQILLS